MLGAVYFLYLAARELIDREVAVIVAVVFCVHPIVSFAAIDARPYAFAALATCATMYILVRLRRSTSVWLATVLGLGAATIIYFQLLFAVILPGLAISLVFIGGRERRELWRQFAVASGSFCVAFLAVVPGVRFIFRTSGSHPFHESPTLMDLFATLCPVPLLLSLGFILIVVALRTPRQSARWHWNHDWWRLLFCCSLALVPLLILFGVSVATPLHIFVARYRLVAIPGLALCYGLVVKRIDSSIWRSLYCVVLVTATTLFTFASPRWSAHAYTWKYATDFANRNTSIDHAPVLMCSDLPESNFMPMPIGSEVYDSTLFPSLTYYKLNAPVVGLPRALDVRAREIGSRFLLGAAGKRERFLALAYAESYPTLEWLKGQASGGFDVHTLGTFDAVKVLEFVPRSQRTAN
jgi:hypothetical protein